MTERGHGAQGDPREHLANERTFLAWIGSEASLVSFGLAATQFEAAFDVGGFGIALLALGCLTLVVGMLQFFRTRRQLATGEFNPSVAGYVTVEP
jgi:putative membrane protein